MKRSLLILLILLSESKAAFGEDVKVIIQTKSPADFTAGKNVYEKYCIKCHAPSNIMVPSPKFGDTRDWQERAGDSSDLKQLLQSALKGKNAMPRKGMCLECKEKDLESAIAYMIRGEK